MNYVNNAFLVDECSFLDQFYSSSAVKELICNYLLCLLQSVSFMMKVLLTMVTTIQVSSEENNVNYEDVSDGCVIVSLHYSFSVLFIFIYTVNKCIIACMKFSQIMQVGLRN